MRPTIFPALMVMIALALCPALPADARIPVVKRAPLKVVQQYDPDSFYAGLTMAAEALQNEAQMFQQFAYPGERSVYTKANLGPLDIIRMDADVHLDLTKEGELQAETRVSFVALEETDSATFWLELPELVSLTVDVENVLDYTHQGDLIKITFDPPLDPEQEVELTFVYGGELDCETKFMLPTCRLSGGIWYVTHSQFLPTKYNFDDVFLGTMRIFVSGKNYENYAAGGTGTFMGATPHLDSDSIEFVFEHIFHTGLFAFSVGQFQTIHGAWEDTPVSVVTLPKQAPNAGSVIEIIQGVLGLYSDLFGQYPWNKLDAVTMPNSFSGGFGPASTIMMSKFAFEAPPGSNGYWGALMLISHELGHQWWGNFVEMADVPSIIISEGLAEFSSNYHFEQITGSRWGFVDNGLSYMYTVPHDEEPFLISPYVHTSPYYYQVVYNKGSQVFDMLRTEIGEETLLAALSLFVEMYGYEYASVFELFDVLEEVSGQDLDAFFAQWLEGKGYIKAELAGEFFPEEMVWRLRARQTKGPPFSFTLPITFEHADGTFSDQAVKLDSGDAEFELAVDSPVLRVIPDPRRKQMRHLYAGLPGDLDLSGVVDGEDLVEMSFSYQVNIIMGEGYGSYFVSNPAYLGLADITSEEGPGDPDGQVDELDLALLIESVGQRLDYEWGAGDE